MEEREKKYFESLESKYIKKLTDIESASEGLDKKYLESLDKKYQDILTENLESVDKEYKGFENNPQYTFKIKDLKKKHEIKATSDKMQEINREQARVRKEREEEKWRGEERERERIREAGRQEEREREREIVERREKEKEREKERERDGEDGLKSSYKVVVLISSNPQHKDINVLLDKGYIPIGGLTEGPSGTSRQVMYRKAFKTSTTNSDTALIDLSDPPTTPIQETLEGVFNTSGGGKRKNKKSKKYISKRKNKTKKRNFNY